MRLLLVDISGLAHAAWHASANQAVNTMRTSVLALVRAYAADFDRVAICCDAPGKKWRHELDAEYKANRPPPDQALLTQIRELVADLESDGAYVFERPGQEADDLIATLVAWARDDGTFHTVVVMSGDKDLAQLVHDSTGEHETAVTLYRPNERREFSRGDVVGKWGVPPERMADYLALVGDSSDNVPGVKGVGPKTAQRLLEAFGDLDGITDAVNLDDPPAPITPKLLDNLLAARDKHGRVAADSLGLVVLDHEAMTADECAAVLSKKEPKPMTTTDTSDAEWDSGPGRSEPPPAPPTPHPVSSLPTIQKIQPAPKSSPQVTRGAELAIRADMPFERSLEPMTPAEAWYMTKHVIESRLFSRYGKREAVFMAALMGRSLGLDMMTSLRGINIVNGKPELSAALMQALVLRSGKASYFTLVSSTESEAVYKTHRVGDPEPVTMDYTESDARRAGLWGQSGNWSQRPRTMLRWRCVAELARAIYPDVVSNCYVDGEITAA